MRRLFIGGFAFFLSAASCVQIFSIDAARRGWAVGTGGTSTGGTAGAAGTAGTGTGTGGAGGGCGGGGGGAPLVCDAQTVCWDHLWGSAATTKALAVAVDPSGGTYVVGQFSGSVMLDCAHTLTGEDAADAFLVALTPSGSVSWVQTISGPLAQTLSAVTVDSMGDVIVGGYTQSSVPVGAQKLSASPGLLVAQFKGDGTLVWVTSFGGSDGSSVDDVTTDTNGDVALAGKFLGTINLGSGPNMAAGTAIAWTGTLQSSDGLPLNGGTWGTGSGQVLNLTGYRQDGSGYQYVAGTFQGVITPPGINMGPLTASGSSDVFLVKYYNNSPNKVLSQAQIGGTGDKMVTALTVDGPGNVLLGGQFAGSFTFLGTPYMAPASGTALFAIMWYGQHPFAYAFGDGPGEVHASVDQAGNVVLAGGFLGTISLGGQQGSTPGTNHNVYAAKLTSMGGVKWLHTYADVSESSAHGVAALPLGDSIVVGEVSGAISFGDGGTETLAGTDALVMRLGQ